MGRCLLAGAAVTGAAVVVGCPLLTNVPENEESNAA